MTSIDSGKAGLQTLVSGSLLATLFGSWPTEKIIKRIFEDKDPLAPAVRKALEAAFLRFEGDFEFEMDGAAYHSLAFQDENLEYLLSSLYISAPELNPSLISCDHLEDDQIFAIDRLVEIVDEEFRKHRELDALLATKEHHRETREILATLKQDSLESSGAADVTSKTISNVRHQRNPNFEGREESLRELHDRLHSGDTTALVQAVRGDGGVGKTQVAIEYLYRHRNEYRIIWWLRAEDRVTLSADYAKLALQIPDLAELDKTDQPSVVQAVRRWLEDQDRWLLVFDNAMSSGDLDDFLPNGSAGHVIVTSRSHSWGNKSRIVEIGLWPRDDSIAFLLRRSGDDDPDAADGIAELLGDLPLALEHAGAYVEATGRSLSHYQQLLEDRGLKPLDVELDKDHGPVSATWDTALKNLKEECEESVSLMYLLAFFAPDAISLSLLSDGAGALEETLANCVTDPLDLDRLVRYLRKYGLVTVEDETISVHRVLQHVIRDSMDLGDSRHAVQRLVKLIGRTFLSLVNDPERWDRGVALAPHVTAIAEHAEEMNVGLPDAARALNLAGICLNSRAAYTEAEPFYRRALEIREKVLGPEHADTATCLNNLAVLLATTGGYREAEILYRRALEIREKVLGLEHADTATSLSNLASLLEITGRYPEAEPFHRRALEIREEVLGLEHADTANSQNNLASLLETTGRYPEAESLFRSALDASEKVLGAEHHHTATSLSNLGTLLSNTGRYPEAEPFYRRALQIREKVLGREHPATANSLCNLASLLSATGRYPEAEPFHRRALEILEKVLGAEHPATANSLCNLASLLSATGRYPEAEPFHRRALEIYEKVLGPEHPHTASVLNNLAVLLSVTGRYPEAEILYRRALEIRENVLGTEHPDTSKSLSNLVSLLRKRGKDWQAKQLLYRRGQIPGLDGRGKLR